ncbi:MAG: SDR family oxidoreductase [Bacteroidota bacterium]
MEHINPPYFQDRNAWGIILGGSSGIGLACAQKLAQEGMHLCIAHRDRRKALPAFHQAMEELRAQGVSVMALNIDALKPEGRVAILDQLAEKMQGGKVRMLLHGISKGSLRPMHMDDTDGASFLRVETPATSFFEGLKKELDQAQARFQTPLEEADFAITIQAMATSLYDWVKALHERRLFAEDARVLGLTSEGGRKVWRNYAAVSAAKAALEAVSRSIALEFAPFGIRSNVLQPGITDTPSLRMIPGQEVLRAQASFRNPYGRLTLPEDVANVVYLMCRDEAAWINGALIPVDGGEKNQ